jgi:RimJ/RimL family protein N-acetyltransferase
VSNVGHPGVSWTSTGERRWPGCDRLILAVGVDNPNARRLYERLGYVDWDHGTIAGTWVERDHHGSPITLSETCHVLVKRL